MNNNTIKSFIIDGSERSVQDTVSKLKFISKIEEGEIVDVHTLTLYPLGLVTSLYRTFFARGEGRDHTLNFFRRTIQDAFDLALECFQNEDAFFRQTGAIIITAIRDARVGILNHAKTYAGDKMYESKIDTLILGIDARLKDLVSKLEGDARGF